MSYERLNDEESRARVAAIIAAAESLAQDDVRPAKSGPVHDGPSYRKWALGLGLGAVALAGLVVWKQSTRDVTADESEAPSVLVAGDLVTTTSAAGVSTTGTTVPGVTTVPVTIPGGPGTTATTVPSTAPLTTAITTASTVATTSATTAATTAPATTTTTPAATTTTAPPVTVTPVEGPHLTSDPAIESFAAVTGGIATLAGRVPDQATADRMTARANEFLLLSSIENYLQIDPSAKAPVPLFMFLADGIWDGDSATIRLEFGPQIVRMATALKARPNSVISIYVHTDNHASADELTAQTQAQAQSFKDILVAQGVNPNNIWLFAKGATEPAADDSTPDGRQINRRVEVVVSGLYDA